MQVVRGSGVEYYVRDLVPGPDGPTGPDGLPGVAGESPGEWAGAGRSVLGLHGRVAPADFRTVLAGRDPLGDRDLRVDQSGRAVAGFDLVFVAPKSVSLLHLLAPGELADAAGGAHEAAVDDALGHLERRVLGVRRTRGGTTHLLGTTGAVGAGFVHRTSRALDPHLHTHLVTANVAQGVDGVWSSIDSRRLFHHRRALQAVYDASLRHELSRRAGVSWVRGPSGGWDVVGVDPVLHRLFSQRAASIEEHLFRQGGARASPGIRRRAFHAGRPDKDIGQTISGLRAEWRRRALDHGLDTSDLIGVVGRAPRGWTPDAVDPEIVAAALDVRIGTRHGLDGRDLVAVVAESAPGGLPSSRVEQLADALEAGVPGAGRRSGTPPSERPVGGHGARWRADDVTRALGQLSGDRTRVRGVGGDDALPAGPAPERIRQRDGDRSPAVTGWSVSRASGRDRGVRWR